MKKSEEIQEEQALREADEPEESPRRKARFVPVFLSVLAVLAALSLAGAAIVLTLDGRQVRFYMTGPEEMTVNCGDAFEDPGVYAVTDGRLFGEGVDRLPLRVKGQVDTSRLGSYALTYSVNYRFREYSVLRMVHVVDTGAPVITLLHKEGYSPSWFDGYEEEGYTATDFCDGDLTERVERQILEDKILYTVRDSAGNLGHAERPLEYVGGKPEIRLRGGETLELRASMYFKDPGYSAVDSQGRDLTDQVQVEGEVRPYEEGEYTLRYSLTNAMGETVSALRTVKVYVNQLPQTVDPEKNTIYLTFDDGPGPYTDELLDVLLAYGVKATFFVTCANPDYADMIGRAYREGHTIGVHSASHNYYEIYSSEQAFFDDFEKVQDLIYEQTGTYAQIFRFPGGSSNTVSSFNKGIMSRLAESMEKMGYKYYDWNVDSGDAGGTTKTKQVAANIIDGCEGRRVSVVLQHDIKDYSVDAVEAVIQWGRRNGYQFAALDLTSPDVQHAIAN